MWKALKAIMSGKRGMEVYDCLTPGEKVKLNELATRYGVPRRERRKLKRYVEQRLHRRDD